MISPKKLKANQNNAQKSTGPKSISGRSRSSKNAFKHGLSKRFFCDENQHQKVLKLAQKLCGGRASSFFPQALELAQAQIELGFIRSLKLNQFQSADVSVLFLLNDNTSDITGASKQGIKVHQDTYDFAIHGITKILTEIRKLERYERIAINRLKLATKQFLMMKK